MLLYHHGYSLSDGEANCTHMMFNALNIALQNSLEKLRKRQRDEALETERLIQQFSDALSVEKKSLDDLIQQGTRASSILAAFDYGFQSRSGGASARIERSATEAR